MRNGSDYVLFVSNLSIVADRRSPSQADLALTTAGRCLFIGDSLFLARSDLSAASIKPLKSRLSTSKHKPTLRRMIPLLGQHSNSDP